MSQTIKKYLAIINSTKDLSAELELELILKAKEGSREAKTQIISSFLKLIFNIATKYQHRLAHIYFEDLVHEGVLGIEDALDKFDPKYKTRFATIANWWIRARIRKFVRSNMRIFDVPTGASGKIYKIARSKERLAKKLNRRASNKEISEDLGFHEDKIEFYSKYLLYPYSTNQVIIDEKSGRELTLEDILPDDRNNGREALIRNDGIKKIRESIEKLSYIHRTIIKHRYGLNGKKLTLKEVGKKLDLTPERIRQIQNQAQQRLKILINK